MMKRRSFLRSGSILSLPLALNGVKVGVFSQTIFEEIIDPNNDRVFVLIQQNGGNDGLNTIIPIDQYDNLASARSDILIPENRIIKLTEQTGLHPVMTGVKELYDQGMLNIIQNVGYPNQNRSHFRSTDIWDTGSAAQEVLATGWIGRYLDSIHSGFPEDYPNSDFPHPVAITLGPTVSETCQGIAANFSLAINDPTSLSMIPGTEGQELPDNPYGRELTFLRQILSQTNEYAEVLSGVAEMGTNLSPLYPEQGVNRLADQLRTVAQLISGGLQTRIYIVNINGFDTHANQTSASDSTVGIHANLLTDLSQAVHAFMDDLQRQGLDQRVIAATRSEFGRKIVSNGSFGTDHGNAAPLLVFGSCVNPGMYGENPTIGSNVDPSEGVEMKVDFRNVFGSILIDWLGASETTVQSIFSNVFTKLPIVTACSTTPTTELPIESAVSVRAFPNPFLDNLTVRFKTPGGPAQINLIDASGQRVAVLADENYAPGEYTIEYKVPDIPPGTYYYQFVNGDFSKTQSLLHF